MNKTLLRDVGNYTNRCGGVLPERCILFTSLNLAGNGLTVCRGTRSCRLKAAVWAQKGVK